MEGHPRQAMQGAAIVEFVVVLPLLLMLILATAELGRAFQQYSTLTQTLQDGARYVADKALFGSTGTIALTADVVSETENVVVYGNILGSGNPLLPGLNTDDVTVASIGSGRVEVSTSYSYDPIFGLVPRFGFGPDLNAWFTFDAAVVARAL